MKDVISFREMKGSVGILAAQELKAALGICCGLGNKEIAKELNCSPATIKKSVERIFYKLGVSSRAAMVAEVIKRGVISPAAALALLLAAHGALATDPMAKVRRSGGSESKIETRIASKRHEIALAA